MNEESNRYYLVTMPCDSCGQPNSIIGHSNSSDQLCAFCSFPIKINSIKKINGFVYILSNKLMPGILKIGFTERRVEDRVQELNKSTGVPSDFDIEVYFPTDSPSENEARVHKLLSEFRIKNKEFFKISLDQALRIMSKVFVFSPVVFNENVSVPKRVRWLQCKTCDWIWEINYDTTPDPSCPKCGWHLSKRLSSPTTKY